MRFIRKRLFAIGFSLLFFIVFGTAFYLIYLDSEAVKEQIKNDFNEQQLILARQVSGQAGLFLDNLVIQIKGLQNRSLNADKSSFGSEISEFVRQNQYMGIMDAGIISLENNAISYFPDKQGKMADTVHLLSGLANINTDRISVGNIYVDSSRSEGNPIKFTIYAPIEYQGRKELFFTRLNLVTFFEKIAGNIRSGKTGYAWVIDETGLALFHAEKSFIGRNIFVARQKREPYVSFSQINNIMKERMMKGEEGTGIYESWWHRDFKGHTFKLIAFTPVRNSLLPNNKLWSIAVVAPISEVADAVGKAYNRHIGAEAAIIIGMFLFVLLMVNYQKKISAALKERVNVQEEYISSILGNSLDGIIITDRDNRVKVWNKGAEKIFEYSAEEMVNNTFHCLLPPEIDAGRELGQIEELVMKNGYISNYITQRITKSGRRITVNISRTLITNDKGEKIGDTIIIRDETGKKELEQRIYNTEKLASIGNLAAGVAHEINNPLTVVLGFTDLMLEHFPDDSQEYEDLKVIESNANNAKKIVENLLGFARITEGMEDNIDVKHSIETVINIVKNTLFTQKIEIVTDIDEKLPHVKGDVREYQQVLFNLINNSVAAMKEQGKGRLTISARLNDGLVDVLVSDTGSGIPEGIRHRIFDPFFTTKKVGEGTGLGLSLCYGIINKYGGKISFTSRCREEDSVSHGTTFTVSMPAMR
jgi:PAS domain S-box-containing protein